MPNPTPGRMKYQVECPASYRFPVDMLRYDASYPSTSDDAHLIEDSYTDRRPGARTVTLVSHRSPTVGRWASFGCTVTEVTA